jgi:hypothetical protein
LLYFNGEVIKNLIKRVINDPFETRNITGFCFFLDSDFADQYYGK